MGLDRVVAHRQQVQALAGQAPPVRQSRGDLREGEPLAEPLRPDDVGAQVEVAQAEPLRLCAVCRELGLDPVALLGAAPALALMDAAAEGVEQGVQVRTDAQAPQGDVVAGVADDGDLVLTRRAGDPVQVAPQPPDEPGPAHAA